REQGMGKKKTRGNLRFLYLAVWGGQLSTPNSQRSTGNCQPTLKPELPLHLAFFLSRVAWRGDVVW
ncbi:MAG: hypothetical protein ACQERW_15365, partial [Cyanobacteriota bacterium]